MTIGGQTFALPPLFLVLATQNPIEHEGTYPLPEAQVDRFMFKLVVTYPDRREEREVLDRMTALDEPAARKVIDPERVIAARRLVQAVYTDERIKEYVLDLVGATRRPQDAGLARPGTAGRVRRLAAGGDLPAPRGQGARLHPRPRVRDAGRHQGAGARRAPAPRDPDLPRRRGGRGARTRCSAGSSRRCRCHDARGGLARGPADRDHHPSPRARHRRRRILERLPRPGRRVRRGARVPAGRRRPHHRLERHRPARRRLRRSATSRSGSSRCCSWWT